MKSQENICTFLKNFENYLKTLDTITLKMAEFLMDNKECDNTN